METECEDHHYEICLCEAASKHINAGFCRLTNIIVQIKTICPQEKNNKQIIKPQKQLRKHSWCDWKLFVETLMFNMVYSTVSPTISAVLWNKCRKVLILIISLFLDYFSMPAAVFMSPLRVKSLYWLCSGWEECLIIQFTLLFWQSFMHTTLWFVQFNYFLCVLDAVT